MVYITSNYDKYFCNSASNTDLGSLIGNFDCGYSNFPATLISWEIKFG